MATFNGNPPPEQVDHSTHWSADLTPFGRWLAYLVRRWRCEACGSWHSVDEQSGRTMYHHHEKRGSFKDPNRSVGLCNVCADEYHAHWDEMWAQAQSY